MACVDGSEVSRRAADFSIALAKKLESKVIFVNVVGASTSEREYNISADMVGSFERLGVEALTKCEGKARENGVRFEIKQLSGDPADEIVRYASESKCDCVVLGKVGMSKIERILLGSVSEQVLNKATVPVIIVR